jgi:hypothetical protein
MSSEVGSGSARSPVQSVSVVPTIQRSPHGMKNSTLFSVFRIIPEDESTAARGTTMCTPLDIRTLYPGDTPASSCTRSVHTPAQITTRSAATVSSRPVSSSLTRAPATRPDSERRTDTALARVTITAPCAAAVRATVIVYRASSTCAS